MLWRIACCLLLTAALAAAQSTQPALSDDQLIAAVQRDLGRAFDPSKRETYLTTHAQIERYFAAASMKEREAIARELSASRTDVNLIGRLTRVRRGWRDLSPGTYFFNEQVGPVEVKYFLGVPERYDRLSATPLVIVLPTADAFLTDPPPDSAAVVQIYRAWMKDELARQRDALVLMPLLNLDELYGPSRPGMNGVIQAILHAADVANVDPARVYLMGHSLGGHAAWNLALHYPTYFSAIAPLGAAAGADWQRLRLMNLRNVYPVVWHDADDEVIPIDAARSIVRALRGLKFDIHFTETKNLGHNFPVSLAGQITETMRARSRELYPREVMIQSNKPETIFNRADWIQIYQPARPGPEKRLLLTRGTGPMLVYQNACNVKASIADNRITLSTDNVQMLRVYVNDQMIDPSRAISVVVNGRVRFEGTVTPDVDAMMKDQLFLGRGWRYYSAFVDIDFSPPPATTRAVRN